MRPVTSDDSQAVLGMCLECRTQGPRIGKTGLNKMLQAHFCRQDYFEVIRRMQGVFVVLGMASPKHDMAAPAEKAEQAQKYIVEQARLEYGIVAKFVRRIEKEYIESAIGQ